MKLPKLLPFQKKGVRKLVHFNLRALLGDEQGLGKTVSAFFAQVVHNDRWPVVVVCPAIAKYVWEDQCWQHFGVRAEVLSGRKPPPGPLRPAKVYVINYDILPVVKQRKKKGRPPPPPVPKHEQWVWKLRRLRPKMVIVDEAHRVKNAGASATKAVNQLVRRIKRLLYLTGTPMPNGRPIELLPTLMVLRPDVFNNRWDYINRYCGPKRNKFGWTYTGATNVPELNELLNRTVLIRRRKEDVLLDLPPKTRTVIPVDIKMAEYKEAEQDLIRWLLKNKQKSKALRAMAAVRMVKVGYLIRLAAQLKEGHIVEWVRNHLEADRKNKVIVFAVQRALLARLTDKFPGAVLVNGSTPKAKRRVFTDRFNKDPSCRVLFGNIVSAGTAWSCQSTSTILIPELVWTPGDIAQAEDRIRGVNRGLPGAHAAVHFMLARGTIDEKLWGVLCHKQRNIDTAIDGVGDVVSGQDVFKQVERELLYGSRT